jgi:Holliday junction resolvase-like predicted endonuclease/phosphoserine phosphatase
MKMLPIGIQSFEKLRNASAVYVDKTQHIWNLINSGSVYFLSRPRRFGKSLFVSALSELFAGNKQLFEGLYIYDKWDWNKKYPIIYLDFTEIAYKSVSLLESSLLDFVNSTADKYGVELTSVALPTRFAQLIEKLHEKTGSSVAILIDEYDKPLIDSLSKPKEAYEEIKVALHNFYQVIKAKDKHIKFVFMTGVSRFSGLSVFSALNNLNDITMDTQYASICGYTQEELEANFKEHIEEAGKYLGISYDKTIDAIKRWYNGYSWDGKVSVYNPFSTLLFFSKKKFGNYWVETGTPTFLIEQIRKRDDLRSFTQNQKVATDVLTGDGSDDIEATTLLFQTGYLTIKKEETANEKMEYVLDFPNMEVKKAFLGSIIKKYSCKDFKEVSEITESMAKALKEKDSEGLKRRLVELLANVPYDLITEKESYYHAMFLIEARLSGFEVQGEVHTDKGRIDAVLKKDNSVIVVEIKYSKEKPTDKMIEDALAQIRDRKYYEKYISNDVSLLAIAFGDKKEIACRFEKP